MSYVFISYCHKDKGYAHKLEKALKQRGFEVWLDDRIDYGSEWPDEVEKRLDGCKALILIMTAHSRGSDWVKNELSRAKRKRKNIFPLLLEGDEPWLSVEATQYVDVRGGDLPPVTFYDTLAKIMPENRAIRVETTAKSPVKGTLGEKEQKAKEIVSGLTLLKEKVMDNLSSDIYLEVGKCQVTYLVFFFGKILLKGQRNFNSFASEENRAIESKLTDLGWANSGWLNLGDSLVGALGPPEVGLKEFHKTFNADVPYIADLLITTMDVFSMRPSEINIEVKYKIRSFR